MATDFFDRQDYARRQTRRLVVLFGLAVAAIIVAIYLLLAVATSGVVSPTAVRRNMVERYPAFTGSTPAESPYGVSTVSTPRPRSLWRPDLFLAVAVGTLVVVSLGSLYKISELSAGGEAVALMLGGRAVDPQTIDLAERRLLNVVEEMALASGVPVPPVFVLDNEPSINAFAAGHQPGDAVVAVSAGALKYLSREELQGVMGHEFSHVLNGDMRLNLRLIGLVNGILVLAILGYYILRSAPYMSSGRSQKDSGGGAMAIFVLGLALVVLGYLGVFFGHLIKAAISRQREFLADASAVQFTRNPGGIAGALKKIGGLSDGSRIRDAHAEECSHMFFGDAFASSFFNLFATHPPLAERIKALEPDFDGRFPEARPVSAADDTRTESRRARGDAPGLAGSVLAGSVLAGLAEDAAAGVQEIPETESLQNVDRLLQSIPATLLAAAREPFAAQAVVFSLLLSRDDESTRTVQLHLLENQIESPLFAETRQLATAAASLPAEARLPLVSLTVPALKRASPEQYARFRRTVDSLVTADGKIDLFEYCLRTVLFSYLDVHFGLKKPAAVRYRSMTAVGQPMTVVLSMLAHLGHERPEDADRAFSVAVQSHSWLGRAVLLPREQCTFRDFDAALLVLSESSPPVKREALAAASACIAADKRVTLEEGELLRAVAAVLGCPVPLVATEERLS